MFDKMTAREKTLAKLVALLLPLIIVGWGGWSLMNRYMSNRNDIRRLQGQISQEENKKLEALLAQQRRQYYRDRSGPLNRNQLQVEYTRWLNDLLVNRVGMSIPSIVPQPNPTMGTYRGKRVSQVYDQYTFTVNKAVGDIGQLVAFLEEFEKLDLLHRISLLRVEPQTRGGGAGQPATRTGKLLIDITIELLALIDADSERAFTEMKRELSEENAAWAKQVMSRNIFGLANNPPSISARNLRFTAERVTPAATSEDESGVTTDETLQVGTAKVSLLFDGEDIDENDELSWEVVSSEIADYTFQPEGTRRARFEASDVAVGSYPLAVRVTDNGFPQKSSERTFTIEVEPPPAPRIVENKVTPPPFRFAQTAYVVGSYEVEGVAKCIIEIKPLQQEYHLALGQSFELDGKSWTIRGIESREVVIQVDDELLTFKMGRTLDQPDFRFRIKSDPDDITTTGLSETEQTQDDD